MSSSRIASRMMAVLLSMAAISAVSAQKEPAPILISILKGPSGIGSAWMMAEPPRFADAELRFITASGADLVTAKLISGEIQGGVLPVNVAAKLYNAGVPIKAVAVVGNGMVKFLSADPSIRRLSDIRGKEIQIAGQKATPDYVFRFLAGEEGLKPGSDYYPVYSLAYPEIAAQLAAGRIACAVLPEPFATQAMSLNKALGSPFSLDALWNMRTGRKSYPMSLFVLSDRLVSSRPDIAEALSRAYSRSIAKTLADPAGTGKLAESLDLGMKAAIAQASIPVSAYVYIEAAEARDGIEALLSLFLEADPSSVGGKLPGSGFYTR